jgi:hypothetical protein
MMSISRVDVPQDAPKITSWNTVVSYATYDEAQAAVDRLALENFPVDELEIVGSGLRSVERVTGPMTWNRAVLSGAAGGAWIGVFIGILISLFSSGGVWVELVFGGMGIGAAWGAMFVVSARWYTRGKHNFSSLRGVVATRYDVIALDNMADRARSALGL